MANIDDYLVASYRCNGKGNSDADRDVLKDLSGNGHDIVLKNFGFTLGSGYEGGALVFDGIDDYGICENFPAINDFTFVYKRINLNPSKSTNCFLSKSVSTNQAQQFCSELAYSKNVYVRLGSKDIAVKDIYNPELSIVYVTKESYNGEMDLVSSNYTSTVDNLYIGTFSRGVQAYVWNGAFYALDIYDRTLSDEYLQKALNRMNDIDINWKDGVGEVTNQHLTVSPGSGTGNAAVSFGSVMNKGLDRTLELEITTPKGVKKTLTVNQEGCRQAYITSDGKRWLTSDNQVYGVLKSDAPCECTDTCRECTLIGFDYAGVISESGNDHILIRPLPDNPTKTTVIKYSKDISTFRDADKPFDSPDSSNKCRWNNVTHVTLTNRAYIYSRPQLTPHEVQYAQAEYSSMQGEYVNKIELLIVPGTFNISVPAIYSLTSPDSRGRMDIVLAENGNDENISYDISNYNDVLYGLNKLAQCVLVNKTGTSLSIRYKDTEEVVTVNNGVSYSLDTYIREDNSTDHGKFRDIEILPIG